MSYLGAHEDNNEVRLMSGKSRAEGSLKRFSSTCFSNFDNLPGSLPTKNVGNPKLNPTCLKAFGSIKLGKLMDLPYFEHSVSAGYPTSVSDPFAKHLDISRYLTRCSETAYYFKATGQSMINAGINDNDLLVVDTALKPKHMDIIIAALNGEYKLSRFHLEGPETKLLSANPVYPAITITEEMDFSVHGVVTTVIRAFNPFPYDCHFRDISYPQF